MIKRSIQQPTLFNSSLPISIEVLEKVGYNRYKLQVGHKQMSTKSHKPLQIGDLFWANFSENGGMLTINNLHKKPQIFQNESNFLKLESFELFDMLEKSQNFGVGFKEWLLYRLKDCEDKDEFKALSNSLLAHFEGVVHLPLFAFGKHILFQFRQLDSLNDTLVEFYLAYENLAGIRGRYSKNKNLLSLSVQFLSTVHLLQKNIALSPFQVVIKSSDEVPPIWEKSGEILNIKG